MFNSNIFIVYAKFVKFVWLYKLPLTFTVFDNLAILSKLFSDIFFSFFTSEMKLYLVKLISSQTCFCNFSNLVKSDGVASYVLGR